MLLTENNIKDASINRNEEPKDASTGKDELNLAEFPIALLTEKAPEGVRTLEFNDQIYDKGKKKLVNRKLTIEGSETYGLPAAKDDEVILGLIQLSKRKNFHDKTLDFTRYELITLLGWPNTGQSYARIELALRRWVSVTLHYKNAWWDKSEERWTSGAFHIIDDFELNDSRETTSQMTLLPSRIIWSSRVFSSFVEGHLKNIRYDVYIGLRSAISKRMYRFLDKRFHHTKKCSFDLRDFAHEHIGLSRSYKDCGKLKEKLNIGVKELEEIGFIEPLPAQQRYQQEGRGQWRVIFTKGLPKQRVSPPAESQSIEPEPPPLVAELVRRGVTRATAEELVQKHPGERIAAKIEVFDWLTEKQDRRIEKSPAGYLVKSVINDYATPKGFISREERQRRETARQAKEREQAEQKRREREAEAREQAMKKAVNAYWESLTPEQQAELDATIDAQADAETLANERGQFADTFRRFRRNAYIRQLLEAKAQADA